MKKVVMARVLPGLFAALHGGGAHAQETRLDEVFVTSTTIDDRFQSRRSEASSIHEISGRAIDERRPENLIEMLNAIPGVTADLSSGDELKIKLRGVENQRYMGEKPGVAIVIDGVPVFERTGKVNVDLDNIESIKVIKGGASYLFGEDALAGAVVITTKRGARYKGVTVAADTGSWGYNRQLARAGIAGDWGAGHIQVSHREADDYYWQSAYQADYVDGNLRFVLGEGSDLTFGFEKSSRFKDKHGSVKGATQALLDPEGRIGRDFTRMYDVELEKYTVTYANALTPTSNLLATAYEYRDRTFYWSSPQR
ncbi:MAG: TonB-dependent receptor plug domain-containing protein, partial [Proteobacteria bacterium]|nr:TonB-dependent receptor plug domain-containing protein [Pseudomonadota bacterium]